MSGADRSPRRIVWDLLLRSERWSVLFLLLLALTGVVLETLSLGAVIPVISVLVNDGSSLSEVPLLQFLEGSSRTTTILVVMSVMTVLIAVKHVFTLWSSWIQFGFFARLTVRLTQRLFGNYLYKPYLFHTKHSSSELITNTQSASLVISGAITPLLTLTSDVLVGLSLFVLLVFVEPLATLLSLLVFGTFAVAFQRVTRKRIDQWGMAGINHRRNAMRLLQEGLGGIKEIKVLSREESFLAKHELTLSELAAANQRFSTLQGVPRLFLETLSLVGLTILVVSMTVQGRSGDDILPVLGLFAAGAFRVSPSVNRVITAIQQIRFALPAIRVIESDLTTSIEPESIAQIKNAPRFEALDLRSVSFLHSERPKPVLDGLSLVVNKGDSIGIMGESGVGKSTLIDLMLGLFPPSEGLVLLNGCDVHSRLREWHGLVGYVPQQVFLADASIRSNVAFGIDESAIDDDAVLEALHLAQLDSYLDGLPSGLDSVIGERGIRLSGGQRQRIGIARALYQEPQVLIFDEATSSLDAETEQAFLESMNQLSKDHTMIVVAHRTSTLRYCSQVYRLQDGQLHRTEMR